MYWVFHGDVWAAELYDAVTPANISLQNGATNEFALASFRLRFGTARKRIIILGLNFSSARTPSLSSYAFWMVWRHKTSTQRHGNCDRSG